MHHYMVYIGNTGGTGKWVCKICNYAPKWRICRELANTCPTNEKEALLHLPSATLMYVCTVKVHFQNRSFQPSDRFHRLDFSSILRNMAVQWFEWKSKMNGDIRTEECQDWYHLIWAPHLSHTLNFSRQVNMILGIEDKQYSILHGLLSTKKFRWSSWKP